MDKQEWKIKPRIDIFVCTFFKTIQTTGFKNFPGTTGKCFFFRHEMGCWRCRHIAVVTEETYKQCITSYFCHLYFKSVLKTKTLINGSEAWWLLRELNRIHEAEAIGWLAHLLFSNLPYLACCIIETRKAIYLLSCSPEARVCHWGSFSPSEM